MIIRKTISNHNFVPLFINSIDNTILKSDKATKSNLWNVEYYDKDIFIKPFQSKEVLISINPIVPTFNDVIYLDSRYHTDIYDEFGTITGWKININKNYNIYDYGGVPLQISDGVTTSVDVELSLLHSGKVLYHVFENFRRAGFQPEIVDAELYHPELYGIFECGGFDGQKETSRLISDEFVLPGTITQEGQDFIYKSNLTQDDLNGLFSDITSIIMDMLENNPNQLEGLLALFTPFGLKVRVNLTPEADSPYIVEYNLFNSIKWYMTLDLEQEESLKFYYDTKRSFIDMEQLIYPVPTRFVVHVNDTKDYTFDIKLLIPLPYDHPITINDIYLDNTSSYIDLTHLGLPRDIYGPTGNIYDGFETLDVLFNVSTGLSTNFDSTLNVDYTYDSTNYVLSIPVTVVSDLTLFAASNITEITFQFIKHTVNQLQFAIEHKYSGYLGNKDNLYITVRNDGNKDDYYTGVEYDMSRYLLKDLNDENLLIPAGGSVELQYEVTFLNEVEGSRDYKLLLNEINKTPPEMVNPELVKELSKSIGNVRYPFPITIKTLEDSTGIDSYLDAGITVNMDIKKPRISYDKTVEETKYINKNSYTTIPIDIDIEGLSITSYEITGLDELEYIVEKRQFPILPGTKRFYIDFNLITEGYRDIKLTLYTDNSYIKQITIPFNFYCSVFNLYDDFIFDEKSFYVNDNTYYLSLLKLEPKERYLKFKYVGSSPITITDIEYYVQKDGFGTENVDVNLLNVPDLPLNLVQNDNITLQTEFMAKEFGYSIIFIIFKTPQGDVYMPISSFCNTKYKDIYILSKTSNTVNFNSVLGGKDRNFIKLFNFGDDSCRVDIQKLGLDQDEFYTRDKGYLNPNSINYIDSIFLPMITGKRTAYLDTDLKDMLNTFVLKDDFSERSVKIQDSHIIYKLLGLAISEEADPRFNHEIIDFGYMNLSNLQSLGTARYTNIEITNYGLNAFVVLDIRQQNRNSAFTLLKENLPVIKQKTFNVPVIVDYAKVNGSGIYHDIITFVIQDQKTKKELVFNIPIKLTITDDSFNYIALNTELINFGLTEINHTKDDILKISNYSNERVIVNLDYTGDSVFSTISNMTVGLGPSQTFDVPLHFFPNGIATFTGNLHITVDTWETDVSIIGQGVDYKSPLIVTKNKLTKFFTDIGYK